MVPYHRRRTPRGVGRGRADAGDPARRPTTPRARWRRRMTWSARIIVRLYGTLLRFAPRAFRDAYGDEMRELFAAELANARSTFPVASRGLAGLTDLAQR